MHNLYAQNQNGSICKKENDVQLDKEFGADRFGYKQAARTLHHRWGH